MDWRWARRSSVATVAAMPHAAPPGAAPVQIARVDTTVDASGGVAAVSAGYLHSVATRR